MKPRHAAALALVGWYLIYLPHHTNDQHAVVNVPLSKWYFYSRGQLPDKRFPRPPAFIFHSQRECQEEIKLQRKEMDCPECGKVWREAICVAVDDPRLKSN
jgi:hypothetical protein